LKFKDTLPNGGAGVCDGCVGLHGVNYSGDVERTKTDFTGKGACRT
jgi:hypothetical protein